MGRKLVYKVTVFIEIDADDWATEYGLATDAVATDVREHLTEWVPETLKAAPLGYLFDGVTARVPQVRLRFLA